MRPVYTRWADGYSSEVYDTRAPILDSKTQGADAYVAIARAGCDVVPIVQFGYRRLDLTSKDVKVVEPALDLLQSELLFQAMQRLAAQQAVVEAIVSDGPAYAPS